MSPTSDFRSLTLTTNLLRGLLGLSILLHVAAITYSVMKLELLQRPEISRAAIGRQEAIVALAGMGMFVLTALVFGVWIVRAHRNVRAFDAQGLSHSPGMALGSFFIPVVNYWLPYQAMKELWQASHQPAAWTTLPRGRVLPTWWTLWIGANVLDPIIWTLHPRYAAGLILVTRLEILSSVLHILLCIAVIVLVSQIDQAQRQQVL